ncbi:MAG: hypothetical protein N3B18_10520 [Desulfobacterota bacterium]|nr:hypothetical protein [Thermodesulfobacteriota bacterium]
MNEYILGIWDGHDAGAALLYGNQVLCAINEERLSRRKLEVQFPYRAITACLAYARIAPEDISAVAVSTYDPAKTLARLFPATKEEYYLIRRRKKRPGLLTALKKRLKYKLTELRGNTLSMRVSLFAIRHQLRQLGITTPEIVFVDHHRCHATTAAFFCGHPSCLVITLDGIGDGLSGSVCTVRDGVISIIAELSGKHSLGIFFEHVTNLLNMRELEDEGKVMALANYAYPVPDHENPLLDLINVDGITIHNRYGSLRLYDELKKLLWRYPSEQFAYMAQRTLEIKIAELVANAMRLTNVTDVALAGGIFSNIKVNMRLRHLPGVKSCFVFPHMGDGGLALGAAAWVNYLRNAIVAYPLHDVFWGLDYPPEELEQVARSSGFRFQYCDTPAQKAAELIAQGNIVFWFQGRMEYGPRALGNRSILALPGSRTIKDTLNLQLKMRVWYQPFCPSMLDEEAVRLLQDADGEPNRFMTMGYMVREKQRECLEGVIGIDGSCRPQMVGTETPLFRSLLYALRDRTGFGVVLNTSFNIHGEPLVCSPSDALRTFSMTGNQYLFLGNYLIQQKT